MHASLACLKKAAAASKNAAAAALVGPSPYIVFGLGNYTSPDTKHSIGHLLVDSLASQAAQESAALQGKKASKTSSQFAFDDKLYAWIHPVAFPETSDRPEQELLFVKSKHLMNLSGLTAKMLEKRWPGTVKARRLILIHDDVNVAPLEHKLDASGGGLSAAKGQNGVKSVHDALGTLAFPRVKIGIGRPENKKDMAEWVMGPLLAEQVRACGPDGKITGEVFDYLRSLA